MDSAHGGKSHRGNRHGSRWVCRRHHGYISIFRSDDLWHPDHHDHRCTRTGHVCHRQLKDNEYSCRLVAGAGDVGNSCTSSVDITVDEETHAWHCCFGDRVSSGEKPKKAVCHTQQYPRADSTTVISADQREATASILVTTGHYETTVGLKSEARFDQSGERRIVFVKLSPGTFRGVARRKRRPVAIVSVNLEGFMKSRVRMIVVLVFVVLPVVVGPA